ncbi:5'-AMP-activated protein kinase, regulatory beta subunit [Entomortierella parvispora]|uniref:5'-AMP-activated protein kinase, regulatory beta subunit n=1 Tax=Entomortierella parvispora TaxID=205924 RepID=A0A9P3H316_9FUNG|nr:5'-AMP-activated protein kinase, regulatory beta subunit [Entomortierella parvispora]
MGNTPSTTGNGADPDAAVEAVTFTNSPYQKQHSPQQHQPDQHGNGHQPSYMSHQRHSSSPQPFLGHSSPPQDSIHPSTIPIASMPVDAAPRRFPFVKDQYMNDSPAGTSPFDSESSFSGGTASGDISYQRRQQPVAPRNVLPGGGPRRRASSLVSGGQSYGQYTDTFNEQALLATAAHQDKIEQQRLQQLDGGRSSYRNSARVSRAFGDVDPLKSLSDAGEDIKDGNVPTIITWSQGGQNVYVTGTFNNWKQKVRLNKSTSDFSTILNLPPGTHRIKFIVDDEWKCSTELSAATDAEGNLVNFLEVADEEQDELEGGQDTPINESPVGSYTDQIPSYAQSGNSSPLGSSNEALLPLTAIKSDDANNTGGSQSPHGSPEGAKGDRGSHSSMASTTSSNLFASNSSISNDPPPGLPPHLEKVILNNAPSKEDNSVLPVPNHVVLNHLYACSVKEGVLSISVTARYRKKYITTVFIKPVVTES